MCRWERWRLRPVGAFHSAYYGSFAIDLKWLWAWLHQYPIFCSGILAFTFFFICANLIICLPIVGIRPRVYSPEWMEASKERDRAENCNPVGRYMDRRRIERGPHWVLQDYLPWHQYTSYYCGTPHVADADVADYIEKMKAKNPQWNTGEGRDSPYPNSPKAQWSSVPGI
eukprot:Platyproteum_vivax@DN6924_c0_g1_i4.p1